MKNLILTLLSCLVIGVSGCTDSAEARDARKKIVDAAKAVATWTQGEWSRFASSSSEKLDKLKKEVDALGDRAKQKLGPLWQKLQDQTVATKTKIKDLGGKSKQAWGAAKDDIENAIADLKKALAEAKDSLKK